MRRDTLFSVVYAVALSMTLACAAAPESQASGEASPVASIGGQAKPAAGRVEAPVLDETVRDSLVIADFDCDSRADSAVLVRSEAQVTLWLFRANRGLPDSVWAWAQADGRPSLYPTQVRIAVVDDAYTPGEDDTPALPGYRPSTGCKGLQLADDDTDSYWFYWNADAQQLTYWRR